MRLTRLPLFAALSAAAATGAFVGIGTWDKNKAGLLTALSVMAAATLVRLARGLPFTNADHLQPGEVEQVTRAVRQLARSLRVLLGVTIGAMVSLVLAAPIANAVKLFPLKPEVLSILLRVLSGGVGAALAYVFARLWQIVGSDLNLLEIQSKFIIRAVNRKAREADEEQTSSSSLPAFKTPEGYGRRIQ